MKYNEKNRNIEIKPENKADKGKHTILIELVIKSEKSFNSLIILVKLPISYIDANLKPFFWPSLEDETKQYGEMWQEDLSSIRDPANKFV